MLKKRGHFGLKTLFTGRVVNQTIALTGILMIDNNALVSTLAYVKQKIHSTGASQGSGHFPKEEYGCVP